MSVVRAIGGTSRPGDAAAMLAEEIDAGVTGVILYAIRPDGTIGEHLCGLLGARDLAWIAALLAARSLEGTEFEARAPA